MQLSGLDCTTNVPLQVAQLAADVAAGSADAPEFAAGILAHLEKGGSSHSYDYSYTLYGCRCGDQCCEWAGGCLARCSRALCCYVGRRLDRRKLGPSACKDGLGIEAESRMLTHPAAITTSAARAATRWDSWPSASLTWLAARRLPQQAQRAQQTQHLVQHLARQRDKCLLRKRHWQQLHRQAEPRQQWPAGHPQHSWPTGSCTVCCRSGWM